MSLSPSSDELSTLIKKAVVDDVHELKTELRLEYKAALKDLDDKFTHELESMRSEVECLRTQVAGRFMTFEREVLQDIQEVEKRKHNVMIFGLNESDSSAPSVSKEDDVRSVR